MASPIAYVFWHWPRPEVPTQTYESGLVAFQRSLTSSRPAGLIEALSYRVDSLPWGAEDRPTYEDWYVVEDFSALSILNDAALSGEARSPHDSVAQHYMKGAGGIFKLIGTDLPLRQARFATWVEKPVGPSYQSYYGEVAGSIGRRKTDLWRRQMVLGPSAQFCIHSEDSLEMPATFKPIGLKLNVIS